MEQDVKSPFISNLEKFSNVFPAFKNFLMNAAARSLPLIDAKLWKEVLNLKGVDDLIIYGIGNGEAYFTFRDWLRSNRDSHLIYIEEDIGLLKNLLSNEIGSTLLSDPQVQIYPYIPGGDNGEMLRRIMIQSFTRNNLSIKDPRYPAENYLMFKEAYKYDKDRMMWVGEEFRYLGGGYFYNFYQNIKKLPECYEAVDLFGKAEKVPAIIVGAGPSLTKNGPYLKSLYENALIFGAGSSLPVLKKLGIKPHFGVGVDPNQSQYDRLKASGPIDYPYFFRPRINSNALNFVVGPKLYIPGGNYEISSWIEKELNLKSATVDEGFNVVNFMTDIALKMGCNPIIFVGLDLAMTGDQFYAEGAIKDPTIPQDITTTLDIYGKPTKTRWMWLKEKDWLSSYVLKYPDTFFINATEGGIGIRKVPNMTLQEVSKSIKTIKVPTFDLKSLKVTLEQIEKKIHLLKDSLLKLQKILLEMKEFYAEKNPSILSIDEMVFPEDPEWTNQLMSEIAFHAILKEFYLYSNEMILSSHLMYRVTRDGHSQETLAHALHLQKHRIIYLLKAIELQLLMIAKFF